jgi:hypothetical protein
MMPVGVGGRVRRAWRALGMTVSTLAVLHGASVTLAAQQPETRRVEGRVVLPAAFLDGDSSAVVTVPEIMVTLHRVSPSVSGPLDSMRTDREGRYAFRYLPSGGPEAVYFVSAMYGGIAYFTNPLRELVTTGADAEIAVFDTTSTAFPLTVRGRHLIVGSLDSARERTVVEIFELSNDSTRTIVALETPDALPTWSFVVPEAAREVKAGQGDLPADAFVQSTGKVSLYAAMAPGLKQLSVSYKLPESAFPLELLIEAGAVVLEVLLEEPEATVQGANLVAVEPVGLEGRQFLRFLAQDVRPGATITIDTPTSGLGGRGLYVTTLLGAIGLLMLITLFRAAQRNQRPAGTTPPRLATLAVEVPTPERLAREIADLDAAFAAQSAPSDSVRLAYTRRREELADALRTELAAGGSTR